MTILWIILGLLGTFGLFIVGVALGAARLSERRRSRERVPRDVLANLRARQEREQDDAGKPWRPTS